MKKNKVKYDIEKVKGFCRAVDMHVKPTDDERWHAVAFINAEVARRNKSGRPRLKNPTVAALKSRMWRARKNG